MTGAELAVLTLQQYGVEWISTLCGHGLDPLFSAACARGLRLVDTRNEQTASYIAEAYGRLTRRPGVCAVSSGVAHVNALTGVANAWFDGAPMVLLSAAGALATAGMGHFQDMDQPAVAGPLCRYTRTVDRPERIRQILAEAFAAASFPPGPVHVTLPMDVQRAEISEDEVVPPAPRPRHACAADTLEEVGQALAASRQPLVVAGSGTYYSGCGGPLLRFCERYRIPVVTPIWDRGVVEDETPVFLGVIGAATSGPEVLSEADCIVMAGAEPDYRVGYLQSPAVRKDARVVYFSCAWEALAGSCKGSCAPAADWLSECARRRDEWRRQVETRAGEQAREGLHAVHIIRALEGVLGQRPVLLMDAGSIGQWGHQLLCSHRYPGDWLTCGRSGVVGWGLGGAMAARLAFPQRPVILLTGDGAFTFNVADLECAVRQNLPFVAIVADDRGWGITRIGHVRQFGAPMASSLGPIAFDDLARSLGARGVRATTPEAIANQLQEALHSPEVTVIHVPIVGGNP